MREHLQAAAESGQRIEGLIGPEAPVELIYLLGWFAELSATRGSTGFSILPLSYLEIDAWARLTDVDPTPFEVGVLRRLDEAFLRSLNHGRPASH